MKTKVLVIFSGIFLLTLLTAGYLITHKTESSISITGHSTENSVSYVDNFILSDVDASLNPVTLLNNVSITTPVTQNFSFSYFTKVTNEDLSCDNEEDISFSALLYTKKSVCVNWCGGGYTPVMDIVEEYKPILNNSVISVENILESKVIVKVDIKKNACNQEVYLKTELTPVN
jgi:hypothetical protein